MTTVEAYTLTVTQTDVLYVSHQVTRDLQSLRDCYPKLLDSDQILRLNTAVGIFLLNDAVDGFGFSIEDPEDGHLVYHELRYAVKYGHGEGRIGLGGRKFVTLRVPRTAVFTSWVNWSMSMRNHSRADQERIVQGTDWKPPGSGGGLGLRYSGTWQDSGKYASGMLEASVQEYRYGQER